MCMELIKIEKGDAHWSVDGSRILRYTVKMFHKGLNEHKLISATDHDMLNSKATMQAQKWVDKWEIMEKKNNIIKTSEEAANELKMIENLLAHTLSVDDKVNWENLKKKLIFPEIAITEPIKPQYI